MKRVHYSMVIYRVYRTIEGCPTINGLQETFMEKHGKVTLIDWTTVDDGDVSTRVPENWDQSNQSNQSYQSYQTNHIWIYLDISNQSNQSYHIWIYLGDEHEFYHLWGWCF